MSGFKKSQKSSGKKPFSPRLWRLSKKADLVSQAMDDLRGSINISRRLLGQKEQHKPSTIQSAASVVDNMMKNMDEEYLKCRNSLSQVFRSAMDDAQKLFPEESLVQAVSPMVTGASPDVPMESSNF